MMKKKNLLPLFLPTLIIIVLISVSCCSAENDSTDTKKEVKQDDAISFIAQSIAEGLCQGLETATNVAMLNIPDCSNHVYICGLNEYLDNEEESFAKKGKIRFKYLEGSRILDNVITL